MGLAQIICRGLGPGATIALLVTVGYASSSLLPPPPPPPPVVVASEATPGRLTPEQIARLRGEPWPPRPTGAAEVLPFEMDLSAQDAPAVGSLPTDARGRAPRHPPASLLFPTLTRATLAALQRAQDAEALAQAQMADMEEVFLLWLLLSEED